MRGRALRHSESVARAKGQRGLVMKVELTLIGDGAGGVCTVTREPSDPAFSGVRNAAGESRLLHHVKRELNRQGYDFVKKRMHKDGHGVSKYQQYLRERVVKPGRRCLAIYNGRFQIEGADEPFRKKGEVVLCVEDIGPDEDA